jgi:uncharacterized LabA/DUF88 family protein
VANSVEDEHLFYIEKPGIGLNRAFIFWDHANVFHNLQLHKIRIDYELAKKKLVRDHFLAAAIMYLGKPRVVFRKKQNFFNALEKTGWILNEKPLKISASGAMSQSGVDQVMFLDLFVLAEAEAFEKAIIVSGDQIFVEAIKMLKKLNKQIEVWSFRNSLSRALIWEVGRENVHYLDDVIDEIALKDGKSKNEGSVAG